MPNVPAIHFESALPSMHSTSNTQAPEEIFTATEGDYRARSEMTPQEKKALRGKLKKQRRKRGKGLQGLAKKAKESEKKHRKDAKQVKKGVK